MSQVAFFAALFLAGLAWTLRSRQLLGPVVCCALALPVGLVLWVGVALGLLTTALPFTAESAGLGLAALAGLGAAGSLRSAGPRPLRDDAPVLLAGTALFVLVALGLERLTVVVMTFDSHALLALARSLALHGGIEADLDLGGHGLDERGIFQVLIQSASIFVGAPFLHAASSLQAVCFTAAFAVLAMRGVAGPGRPPLRVVVQVALSVLTLSSVYFVLVQAFHVHDNLPTGGYLLLFAACFWFAETEAEGAGTWLPLAGVFLLAFALQRSETPVVAAFLSWLLVARSTQSGRALLLWTSAAGAVVMAWHARLWLHVDPTQHLNPARAYLVPVVLVTLPAAALATTWLRRAAPARLRRHAPELTLGTVVVFGLVACVLWPEAMGPSWRYLVTDAVDESWGGVWLACLFLGALTRWTPRLEAGWVFSLCGLGTLALIFVIPAATGPYVSGWGGSGNRMLTHVLPLALFGFALVFGRAAAQPASASRTASANSAPSRMARR